MAMDFLVGTHERSVDDKGRLSLPVAFREKLGLTCFVSQLPGSKCVGIWTVDEFHSTIKRLRSFAESEEEGQNQLRQFAASAHEVKQDRSGRIMIPPQQREAAELGKEVLVCGAATRVEIWSQRNWEQIVSSSEQSKETWL